MLPLVLHPLWTELCQQNLTQLLGQTMSLSSLTELSMMEGFIANRRGLRSLIIGISARYEFIVLVNYYTDSFNATGLGCSSRNPQQDIRRALETPLYLMHFTGYRSSSSIPSCPFLSSIVYLKHPTSVDAKAKLPHSGS